MKLKAIFEHVDMSVEEIQLAARGVSVKRRILDPKPDQPRPLCLYCGQPIGHCRPGRRPMAGLGRAWQ